MCIPFIKNLSVGVRDPEPEMNENNEFDINT